MNQIEEYEEFCNNERTSQGARFAQLPDNFSLKVCILGDVLFVDFVDPKTNEVFFATFICIDEEEHKDFGDFTPTGRQLLLERLADAIVNDVSAFIGSENDHGIEYGLPIHSLNGCFDMDVYLEVWLSYYDLISDDDDILDEYQVPEDETDE